MRFATGSGLTMSDHAARPAVLWQSRSEAVEASVMNGGVAPGANGGNTYDYAAFRALSERFTISLDASAVQRRCESTATYALRMRSHLPSCEVTIAEPYPLVFGPRRATHRRIAMVHHLEDRGKSKSVKHTLFQSALLRRLRRVDCVVTVSRYWQDYLRRAGCGNVRIIYNSFDLKEFTDMNEEREGFRKAFGMPVDEPLIYVGNASVRKGVGQVYEALRNRGYHLVMSGAENRAPGVPVRFLNLAREQYLGLLKASDVVVCMSLFAEGWNRIAHEALLCGTPVIGSGAGGMRELLEGARQLILHDFRDLPAAVERVLERRSEYSAVGRAFVEQYNQAYFSNAWHSCVASVAVDRPPS